MNPECIGFEARYMNKYKVIGVKTCLLNLNKNRSLTNKVYKNDEYERIFEIHKMRMSPLLSEMKKENLLKYEPDEIWMNNLILKIGLTIKSSLPNLLHGYLLYSRLRELFHSIENEEFLIVETGTAKGFGSIVMSQATFDHNVKAQIMTFDTLKLPVRRFWNAYNDELGQRNFEELTCEFSKNLECIQFINKSSRNLSLHLSHRRVHFAFLDSSHTFYTVSKEIKIISKFQRKGDLIFIDDVNDITYPGIKKAIKNAESCKLYEFEYVKGIDNRNYAIGVRRGEKF